MTCDNSHTAPTQSRVGPISHTADGTSDIGITPRTRGIDGRTLFATGKRYRGGKMGDVLQFRAPVGSRSRGCLLAQHAPSDVATKLLAHHRLTPCGCLALDDGAVLGGNTVLQPRLDGLMPVVLDIENAGGLNRTTENTNGPLGCGLCGGLGVHDSNSMQEDLVLLETLALAGKPSHEKLARMSIHAQIKRLREAKGWSHQTLAQEINEHEKRPKALAWQAIQQWENGESAPTRKRLPYVALAFGVSLQSLQGLEGDASSPTHGEDEKRLLSACRVVPEGRRHELIERAIQMFIESNPDVARLMAENKPLPDPPKKPKRFSEASKTASTIGKVAKKTRAA